MIFILLLPPSRFRMQFMIIRFVIMEQKAPLMLKDYLALDWDNGFSGASFCCVPRILDSDHRRGRNRVMRTGAMSALIRISAVFRSMPFAKDACKSDSDGGSLTRVLSKRIRVGFRGKRGNSVPGTAEVSLMDDMRQRSCCLPSPLVSVCSGSRRSPFESDIGSIPEEIKNEFPVPSPRRTDQAGRKAAGEIFYVTSEAIQRDSSSPEYCNLSEEVKDQVNSPVSVMDFHSEGSEKEEESPPYSRYTFSEFQRTKLGKNGRSDLPGIPKPVNLDGRFASCIDDVDEEHVGAQDMNAERLLVDLFCHGVSCRPSRLWKLAAEKEEDEEAYVLSRAAREWVEGTMTVSEAEEGGGMRSMEEEEEVGIVLEALLLGSLMAELMVDLAMC